MRKVSIVLLVVFMLGAITASLAFRNVAYVEVNTHALSNVGCFVRTSTGKPFFDTAVIFAANIHGQTPNDPRIYLNPQVYDLLNHSNTVMDLHKKGIKVLAAILGDHQNAGWSCMTSPTAAKKFADKICTFVNQYHLDGVVIDDEWSACKANSTSMIMIAQALKQNPAFSGKLLTKALFKDSYIFKSSYQYKSAQSPYGEYSVKLANFLDSGSQMSYYSSATPDQLLLPYTSSSYGGMSPNDLMLGISTNPKRSGSRYPYVSPVIKAHQVGSLLMQEGWGGVMLYNVTAQSGPVIRALQRAEDNGNSDIKVLPNCLTAVPVEI